MREPWWRPPLSWAYCSLMKSPEWMCGKGLHLTFYPPSTHTHTHTHTHTSLLPVPYFTCANIHTFTLIHLSKYTHMYRISPVQINTHRFVGSKTSFAFTTY